jgi:hypothetical protein
MLRWLIFGYSEPRVAETSSSLSGGGAAEPNGTAAKLGPPRLTLEWKIKRLDIEKQKFASGPSRHPYHSQYLGTPDFLTPGTLPDPFIAMTYGGGSVALAVEVNMLIPLR